MAYSEILFEKKEAIATITINRPQAMNAGTIRTWGEIADAFHDAERDNNIRVVILTGAGRAFCAGDDVKEIFLNPEFRDAKPNTAKDVEEWRTHAPVALDFLIDYPKPTIASVNGAAVGYGCDIALMCDMRVCSDQARFGEVFIRRGLIPEAGGLLVLPRLVGLARAGGAGFSHRVPQADHRIGKRRRGRLRMRHRADVRYAGLLRELALRRGLHPPRADSRGRRVAGAAAIGRTGARV